MASGCILMKYMINCFLLFAVLKKQKGKLVHWQREQR